MALYNHIKVKKINNERKQAIIQLCKHVVAKVTLVPCSVNLTDKRDKVGHGEVTINNARIILGGNYHDQKHMPIKQNTDNKNNNKL